MSVATELTTRSNSQCELCKATGEFTVYTVPPQEIESIDHSLFLCETCLAQINTPDSVDPNHWRFLNDTIWSELAAVKVVSYRMLHQLRAEGWPQDLIDMMYMTEEELKWAEATLQADGDAKVVHKDSNGVVLASGDTVVLVKDLDVKGGGFTAKRGTAVRNISLVADNPEQIEGKVNGQEIVLLTKYLKKS